MSENGSGGLILGGLNGLLTVDLKTKITPRVHQREDNTGPMASSVQISLTGLDWDAMFRGGLLFFFF